MVVFPKQIQRHMKMELPFMATEKILMACVEKGESRQEMHEVIKRHSLDAGKVVKEDGKDNDLLARLGEDPRIPFSTAELEAMVGTGQEFTGRATEQTDEFLAEIVEPRLASYRDLLGNVETDLKV
jgi:adenylosuccinate lyase